jgi:hypothetical protein
MGGNKVEGKYHIQSERAIVYHDKIYETKNKKLWNVRIYLLDEVYVLIAKSVGNVNILGFTDLTTARHEMNIIITGIKKGIYDN